MSVTLVGATRDVEARVNYLLHGDGSKDDDRVAAIRCDVGTPDEDVEERARQFVNLARGLTRGRQVQAQSVIQSFPQDEFDKDSEADREHANDLGYALARRMYPNSPVLVVTHIDGKSGCVHNHIVVINHDLETGHALTDYRVHWQVREANDELMRDEGLSTIPRREDTWEANRERFEDGSFQRRIGDMVSEIMHDSEDSDEFFERLDGAGIDLRVKQREDRKTGEVVTGWTYAAKLEGESRLRRCKASTLAKELTCEGVGSYFDHKEAERVAQREKEEQDKRLREPISLSFDRVMRTRYEDKRPRFVPLSKEEFAREMGYELADPEKNQNEWVQQTLAYSKYKDTGVLPNGERKVKSESTRTDDTASQKWKGQMSFEEYERAMGYRPLDLSDPFDSYAFRMTEYMKYRSTGVLPLDKQKAKPESTQATDKAPVAEVVETPKTVPHQEPKQEPQTVPQKVQEQAPQEPQRVVQTAPQTVQEQPDTDDLDTPLFDTYTVDKSDISLSLSTLKTARMKQLRDAGMTFRTDGVYSKLSDASNNLDATTARLQREVDEARDEFYRDKKKAEEAKRATPGSFGLIKRTLESVASNSKDLVDRLISRMFAEMFARLIEMRMRERIERNIEEAEQRLYESRGHMWDAEKRLAAAKKALAAEDARTPKSRLAGKTVQDGMKFDQQLKQKLYGEDYGL